MKKITQIIALLCLVLNIFGLSLTFIGLGTIENSAKKYIGYKIEQEVIKYIIITEEKISEGRSLEILKEKLGTKIDSIQEKIKNDLPKKISEEISKICKYSCEDKKNVEKYIENSFQKEKSILTNTFDNLSNLIQGKYYEILNKLIKDLRIFFISNIFIFSCILLFDFFSVKYSKLFLIPSVLLIFSTLICTYFYFFRQNWLFTILFNDYVGYGYVFYDLILFRFFADIFVNKARVTRYITEGIGTIFYPISY